MLLSKLITGVDSKSYNLRETEVMSLEFDSRKVKPGSVFIAIDGEKFDGHDFIDDAKNNGAVAVVTRKRVETELPQIVVQDTRTVMGKLARRFYGEFKSMEKIGITGTNGKTTTAFLINSILAIAGKNPGLIGTIYYLDTKTRIKAGRTTPESLDVFKLFEHFKMDGAKAVVMEVSSHALSLKRVDEIRFSVVIFTNLAQDHLDFHKSYEEYKKAKLHIFSLLNKEGFAIYNLDDPISKNIESMNLKKTITYGMDNRGDVWGKILADNIDELRVEVCYKDERYKISSKLVGGFNIYNILAAFATGIALGIDGKKVVKGIEELKSIKGRLERIVDRIFVDFAHTPAAIENVLRSIRKYTSGKLIIVFGCGGDRDKEKRPKMGSVATNLADFTILTSDNPRSEPPKKIIEEIEKGINGKNYTVIEDRKAAIRHAISTMEANDVVLIAGKGHEEYQIIGDESIEFDDAKVIRACFENV
jgi:UDP-N-acetylmuramoyl-L-alanyl-D-glutamate--2,6-diaminopimelate ligase